MIELPLVSVVTPSYNMAGYIEQAISSVLSQDYPRIEYLVIDGGSTDRTIDILRRHEDRLRFISGRDDGPADAINRGFRLAKGSIFAWLNADDAYLPGAITAAVEYFQNHKEINIVYGDGCWIDANGTAIAPYPTRDFDADLLAQECFICQPASFMRSEAFGDLTLSPRLLYAFDYDLWIRAASAGFHFTRIPRDMAYSRMHFDNRTLGQRSNVLRECIQVLRHHYGYVPFSWVHTYCSYLLDRKDQFFEPLRPTLLKYLLSLPVGSWQNRRTLPRYWSEWRSIMSVDAYRRHWCR